MSYFHSEFFQALNLVRNLIIRGLYTDKSQLQSLLTPLMSLLDGRNDVPYPMRFSKHASSYYFRPSRALKQSVLIISVEEFNPDIKDFQTQDRFKQNEQNKAVVEAKLQ